MSTETVAAILAGVDHLPASYLSAARKLAEVRESLLEPVRVGVLSTFTLDPIAPYLRVEGARRGLAIAPAMAPFGQIEQQVLDAKSELLRDSPDVVVVAMRVEEAAPELVHDFVALTADRLNELVDAYCARVAAVVARIRENSRAQVIVWNQAPFARLVAGMADASLVPSQQHLVALLNQKLTAAVTAVGATVFDVARLATELGTRNWYDAKLNYLGRIPMSGAAQMLAAKQLARHVRALSRPTSKCIVVDLDNTLWGGVLGEDGVGGIALGDTYPGSAFKTFQRVLRGYRDRGILLAIASKNNEADVLEVFSHPDMILKLDDFSARQIHWNDKASSLKAIAAELNIGVDALVFFDDNPVERTWVREQLPEVTIIDVPKDVMGYVGALDDSGAFDQLALTAEDRARHGLYRGEAQRRDLQASVGSVEDFLRSLEMKVIVEPINAKNTARVVQLLAKTNQFNVTTRRHSVTELDALLAKDGTIGLVIRVTDRFGDNGLVGVALAVRDDAETWSIDTFLMSCRVLGRRVEQALFGEIARRARSIGARRIRGEFIPTKKNAPSATFFADTGFERADRENHWLIDLASADLAKPTLFEIVEA
jgi:FkbH-like protein